MKDEEGNENGIGRVLGFELEKLKNLNTIPVTLNS
jgi:hypothetical protein